MNEEDLINFDDYQNQPIDSEDSYQNYNAEDDDDIFGDNNRDNNYNNNDDFDIVDSILKKQGIYDKTKIQMMNEDGSVEEINFNDLTNEEKLSILTESNQSPVLTDEEIDTINYLRNNKINLKEFAEYSGRKAIEDYLKQNNSVNYTVDQLSDDELYLFDLQDKYSDLSDEELESELQRAKEDETLFNKKISVLRDYYKKLEDEEIATAQAKSEQETEQRFNELSNSLIQTAQNTNELYNLILEDEDKEEILSFLLDRDVNGQTEFFKMFNDPNTLFKLGWFALKGDEAFTAINDYYKKIIDQSRKQSNPVKTVTKHKEKTNDDPYGLNKYLK